MGSLRRHLADVVVGRCGRRLDLCAAHRDLVDPALSPVETKRIAEPTGLLLLLISIGYLIFLRDTPVVPDYMAVLPLLWAAFRFGQRGAVTSALMMTGIALVGTLLGVGPYAHADPNESLLRLQTFMGTVAIATLVLASVLSEARRAEQRLEVQGSISRILAESSSIQEAAPQIVQVLCERAGWDLGAVEIMDRAATELQYEPSKLNWVRP